MLKCKQCGNMEKFTRTASVTETWFVKGEDPTILIDILESDIIQINNDLECFECNSTDIEEVN